MPRFTTAFIFKNIAARRAYCFAFVQVSAIVLDETLISGVGRGCRLPKVCMVLGFGDHHAVHQDPR